MTSVDELVQSISKQLRSLKRSSHFINGLPGSGKSRLLDVIAHQLPSTVTGTVPLGPYPIEPSDWRLLGEMVVRDCYEAGFVDDYPLPQKTGDLEYAWTWITNHFRAKSGQKLIVLVDVIGEHWHDVTILGPLFSSFRLLETRLTERDLDLHHIVTGCWDHSALRQHYHATNTSFPYTKGLNYAVWRGLPEADIDALVRSIHTGQARPWHGRLLRDLTGGHAAAADEILRRIEIDRLSNQAILEATREVARNGQVSQRLVAVWQHLSSRSAAVLRRLCLRRRLPLHSLSEMDIGQLEAAGIVCFDEYAEGQYVRLTSWFVELVVRLHMQELKISDAQLQRVRLDELVPETPELCHEAYKTINVLETTIRCYVATLLCLASEPDKHILEGRARRLNHQTNGLEDAKLRAETWRSGGPESNWLRVTSPLIAYCSMRDLADLMMEVSGEVGTDFQRSARISKVVRELADVRNVIMHNQIIGDEALARLRSLASELYREMGS